MSMHGSESGMMEVHSVSDILTCLEKIASEHGCVSVGDVVDAIGTRTYAPFLIVPALLEITPIGAIPGVPTLLAVTIAIFAIQMLFGAHHFWIPDIIENRRVTGEKLDKASRKLEPLADKLDHWFHGRLRVLTKGPAVQVAALAVLALCATVPFLEVLPFASSGPMLAIAAFGMALLFRDGLLMIIATIIAVAAVAGGFSFLN